jgi:hypothetical protein
MIRRFDKEIADSISKEGAKLIRTLLPLAVGIGVVKSNKK